MAGIWPRAGDVKLGMRSSVPFKNNIGEGTPAYGGTGNHVEEAGDEGVVVVGAARPPTSRVRRL